MRGEEIRVTMICCDMLMIFHANRLIPVREGKLLLSIISTVKQKGKHIMEHHSRRVERCKILLHIKLSVGNEEKK